MNTDITVEQDLELLANMAARLLATPVATITIYNGNCEDTDDVAHMAVSCDKKWAANNPDIDIKQLGSPRSAMTQSLGLYASMPLRNSDGGTVGMVACAGDEARDFSAGELSLLKHVTALAAAVIHADSC
ncbi:GAF domain-containing protein [Parasphingorhabdus sp. JC815]|uniref:GAF domain-containing protein n=1 Tax=Parasphingorhabdus sp. JC815 TaxID=3232140 RepID=UPI0034587C2F